MWVKPQHNPTVTIRIMATRPKYRNLCRILRGLRVFQNNIYSHDLSSSEQNCSLENGGAYAAEMESNPYQPNYSYIALRRYFRSTNIARQSADPTFSAVWGWVMIGTADEVPAFELTSLICPSAAWSFCVQSVTKYITDGSGCVWGLSVAPAFQVAAITRRF